MSWHTLKSLNSCTKTWGLKKRIVGEDFKVIFEILLKRCGRFLWHLVFDGAMHYSNDVEIENQILEIITNECQNVKRIEIGYKLLKDRNDFEAIKPIFNKLTKFGFQIGEFDITDKDLKDLFESNRKLECLEIRCHSNLKITAAVLYSLPCETIETLKVHHLKSNQLQICSVSINFFIVFIIYILLSGFNVLGRVGAMSSLPLGIRNS